MFKQDTDSSLTSTINFGNPLLPNFQQQNPQPDEPPLSSVNNNKNTILSTGD